MRLRDFRPWSAGINRVPGPPRLHCRHSAWLRPPRVRNRQPRPTPRNPRSMTRTTMRRSSLQQPPRGPSASNKRVLLMFGGDWCGWCHKLHDLFAQNAEIRRLLSYEYELVMIDTHAPHAPELLKECSQGQTGVGFPFLAVMDAGGKLLVGQKTDPFEQGDHHDPKKVKEFLARWVVEPKDARVVRPGCAQPGSVRGQEGLPDLRRALVRLVPQARRLPAPSSNQRDPGPRFRRPESGRRPDELGQGRDEEVSTRTSRAESPGSPCSMPRARNWPLPIC